MSVQSCLGRLDSTAMVRAASPSHYTRVKSKFARFLQALPVSLRYPQQCRSCRVPEEREHQRGPVNPDLASVHCL